MSFDDGPSESTPLILEALAREQVRATFFMCGHNVERLPRIARDVLAAGHEIGNHTYSHPCLLQLGPRFVRREVVDAQRTIEDRLDVSPYLFRPPFGVRSPFLGAALDECALIETQWTAIGYDWRLPVDAIVRRVLERTAPGGVICLHDGDRTRAHADRRATAAALAEILPRLCDRGYRFVTAGEALGALFEETERLS